MRIGIDARLTHYRQAGISTYTVSLLRALAEVDADDEFTVLQSRKSREHIVTAPNVRRKSLWTPAHHRWEQVALPLELAPLGLDLLHSPDFIPPFHRRCRAVVTIHDLAFLRYPETLTDESRRYYRQVKRAVESADAVIAVSESTKDDIVELLGEPERKIAVVYEAAANRFRPVPPADYVEALRARFDVQPGYFLFVSTIEPRKNLLTLLRAYALLHSGRRASLPPLVVAGAKGWLKEPALDEMVPLPHGSVRFVGAVTDEELLWLYNGALALTYPSLYEGFGLPPLEAMACGTPVICSNTSSLPEVVGEAGLLVAPLDEDGWARAMGQVLEDETLRQGISAKGLERVKEFSWEKAARETLAVYRKAVR